MPGLTINTRAVEETEHLGARLGRLLAPGDVICLSGDLGAGKTAFVRGVGAGWEAQEAVTSPTFTLIHEHHRAQNDYTLYHVDCYRLSGAQEAWDIGLEDLLYGEGAVVLEWPENIQAALPESRLWIAFDFAGDTQRTLHLQATGTRYQALLAALRS